MNKKRTFISFDFDHDEELRNLLVGQAKNPDSPFEITDYSLKEPFTGDWKEKVRNRIKKTEVAIVICGHHTDTASGVSAELSISKEERISYFLICGRSDGKFTKPTSAGSNDKVYNWTWDNLKALINGAR
ncbi:hypothetical protein A2533_01270 [Candidatus Falkowbacteria bacterium RIFOXYD2_FULL_35_9]|nr:MAG: hypothetical protein A2533_01270 [Candidatus Falkowbacteria bacterium RIFOXYD2_FULL_35_9]HIJ01954.1 hypothetical protein [Candidatus Woesearchaeota archaeon]